ncbi:MAG: DUF2125 domain-containing protein [Silicimonas sp.]|jgi:hypothetical protein|nr:DUF2125 domain-containing protein [Silicimonas sp.]
MTFTRNRLLTSALALAVASPALADLTAEQVLEDQLRQMELYGLAAEVTGQSRSGDTLVVDGLSATADVPEGAFSMTMGGATFRELGDGTVEITYPDVIPIGITGTSDDGEAFEMEMSLSQTNTRTLVSGIPEEITYEFTSDSFSLGDLKFLAPEEAAEMDLDISVQSTGLSGTMQMIGGGTLRDYTADFAVESISMAMTGVPDDESEGAVDFSLTARDIVADYAGSAAPQDLGASFAEAIQAGTKTKGTAKHGPLTYELKADTPDGSLEVAAAAASGDFEFEIGQAGLGYGTTARDTTISVGGSSIPLPPLTFKMAESGMKFGMPVVPSEEEQDFALRLSLEGLEVDPMLWGMIDPAGQLPRDPASLVIDLQGLVTLTEDVFAPEFAEEMTGPPGQINALSVNRILLTLAGAELTGDGEFSFNNAGPVPMPSGVMNMMLTGGNGLLDTLVGMGLVPEDQAMGARMMMGLFAQPGEGEDTLISTIEMKEDGSVLANGQRIK